MAANLLPKNKKQHRNADSYSTGPSAPIVNNDTNAKISPKQNEYAQDSSQDQN